jgi:exonuclease III
MCVHAKTKHGLAMYVLNDSVKEIKILTTIMETVSITSNIILIVSVYVPPSTTRAQLLNDAREMIDQIEQIRNSSTFSKSIIMDDFNTNLQTLDLLSSLMEEGGLHQKIAEPTHEQGSILYLIFTDLDQCVVHNTSVVF